MKKQIKITTLIITLIFSLNLFAETKTFPTITDAINYSGDKSTVTKLVTVNKIKGDDIFLQDTFPLPVWAIGWLFWDIENDSIFVIPKENLFPIAHWNIHEPVEMLGAKFYGDNHKLFSYSTSPQLPAIINTDDEFYVELKCNSPELISEPTAVFFRMFTTYYSGNTEQIHFAEYAFIVTVGILEKNIYDITISPNPATDFVTVGFDLEKYSYLEINLYDITGIKIKEIFNDFAEPELFTKTINVKKLNKGIYFLKINNTIKKIIIN